MDGLLAQSTLMLFFLSPILFALHSYLEQMWDCLDQIWACYYRFADLLHETKFPKSQTVFQSSLDRNLDLLQAELEFYFKYFIEYESLKFFADSKMKLSQQLEIDPDDLKRFLLEATKMTIDKNIFRRRYQEWSQNRDIEDLSEAESGSGSDTENPGLSRESSSTDLFYARSESSEDY